KHNLHAKEVEVLDKLFKPISDQTCSGLIKEMDSLDAVIDSSEGSAKDAATAVKVKKRAELDNYCRGVVCDRIDEIVTDLTNHDNAAHAELIALLTSAESEIKGNMSDAQSEIGAEPTDAVGKKQQELQDALLEAAQSGDSAAAEKAAQTLSVLEAMINGDSTDSAAAAELSGEMLDEAMSSIGDEISAILNGTHDYYKEGGSGMSAQEVLAQIQTDIADAEQLAKDKAFYTTGSTTSDEYNKQLSGDLSSLGLMLSALAESGSGSDDLSRLVISAAADSADSVLSAAAEAEASAKPATDEQKQIKDLESRLDGAYGKYLDALNSGDDSSAESALALVDSLREQLDGLRGDVAAQVGDLVKELFGEMNSADPDKDKLRELNAQLSVDKGYLSDVDRALLEQALAAVEDMQSAVESGSVSKSETAYDQLSGALQNVPGDLLDDSVKADILGYVASLLAEGAGSDGAQGGTGSDGTTGTTGAGNFAGLLDDIMKDISAANRGEFTPDTGDIEDIGDLGDIGGTGGAGVTGADGSIIAALYEYKLVIPSLNIYSNTMSIEKGGTVFIDMQALAREAGLKRFVSGEVYVFRGDDILIELTPGSSTAYVGDKLYAPSAEPYFSGDVLYVPADLVAAGLKLTAETENGTTFIR
ncbi:MAG: stalk domain-containing protein, partial [Oscillospiraceae bacterium]